MSHRIDVYWEILTLFKGKVYLCLIIDDVSEHPCYFKGFVETAHNLKLNLQEDDIEEDGKDDWCTEYTSALFLRIYYELAKSGASPSLQKLPKYRA